MQAGREGSIRATLAADRCWLVLTAAEAIASGCSGCTQLTALDVRFGGYCRDAPAVPAWRQLGSLAGLRRLHVSTGVGWEAEAFEAVAAAATALRALTVTDNAGIGGP